MATSLEERLKLKQYQVDTWTTREQLCLASAVMRSGDQNWVAVRRNIKMLTNETSRPPDWYSTKNCALQYAKLLECVDTPKRKRERGDASNETPGEIVTKMLSKQRVEELRASVTEERTEYDKLRREIQQLQDGLLDSQLDTLWEELLKERAEEEEEERKHQQWLKEREEKITAIQQALKHHGPKVPIPPNKKKKPQWPSGAAGLSTSRRNSGLSETSSEVDSAVDSPDVTEPMHESPASEDNTTQEPEPKPTPPSPLLSSLLNKSSSISGPGSSTSPLAQLGSSSKAGRIGVPPVSLALQNLVNSAISGSDSNKEHSPKTSRSPGISGSSTLSRLLDLPPSTPGTPLQRLGELGGPTTEVKEEEKNEDVAAQVNEEEEKREDETKDCPSTEESSDKEQKTKPDEEAREETTEAMEVDEENGEKTDELNMESQQKEEIVEGKDRQIEEEVKQEASEEGKMEGETTKMEDVKVTHTDIQEREEVKCKEVEPKEQEAEKEKEKQTKKEAEKSVAPIKEPEQTPKRPGHRGRKKTNITVLSPQSTTSTSSTTPKCNESAKVSVPTSPVSEKVLPHVSSNSITTPSSPTHAANKLDPTSECEKSKAPSSPKHSGLTTATGERVNVPVPGTPTKDVKDGGSHEEQIEAKKVEETPIKEVDNKDDKKKELKEDKFDELMKEKDKKKKEDKHTKQEEPSKEKEKKEDISKKMEESKSTKSEEKEVKEEKPQVSESEKRKDSKKSDDSKSKEKKKEDEKTGNKKKSEEEEEKNIKKKKEDEHEKALKNKSSEDLKPLSKKQMEEDSKDAAEPDTDKKKSKGQKKDQEEDSQDGHDSKDWMSEVERILVRNGKRKVSGGEFAGSSSPLITESAPNSPASTHYGDDPDYERSYRSWKKPIMILWNEIAAHKFASLFLRPITDDQAPGYHSVVYRPMDLQTIKRNIESGIIRNTAEFQRDMMLMFLNAKMYNTSDHNVYHMAHQMMKDTVNTIEEFLNTQMLARAEDTPQKSLRRETRESSAKRSDDDLKRKSRDTLDEKSLKKRRL